MRALVANDIPALAASKITSGTLSAALLPAIASTLITGVMTVSQGGSGTASASATMVFAGPATGGAAAPGFRALTATDIPTLDSSYISDYDVSKFLVRYEGSSTSITVATTDQVILVGKTATGAVQVNLPSVASVTAGKSYIIKDFGGLACTNNITIKGNGSELIDNANTHVVNVNYDSITVVMGGTPSKWSII